MPFGVSMGGVYTGSLSMSAYTYIFIKDGANYKCYLGATGQLAAAPNANFATLFNAITAASSIGDSYYIRPGAYSADAQLNGFKSGQELALADGAVITFTTAGTGYAIYGLGAAGAGNHKDGLYIHGGELNFSDNSAGIGIKWWDNVEIAHMKLHGTKASGTAGAIDVYAATGDLAKNINLHHLTIWDIYNSGLNLSYLQYWKVHHCDIRDTCEHYPSGGCIQAGAECGDGEITDNTLRGHTHNDGCYLGNSTSFNSRVIVKGNNIDLTDGENNTTSGIKAFLLDSQLVANNIHIVASFTGTVGIRSLGTGMLIMGNREDLGTCRAGIICDDGTDIGGSYYPDGLNVVVCDNSLTGAGTYGLYILQDRVTMWNNRVRCTAGGSVTISGNSTSSKYVGNDLTGSSAALNDGGVTTVKKSHIDNTGAWVA